MKMCVRIFLIGIVCLLMPGVADAQIVNRIRSLHEVLETLYDDMMPLCSRLIGVGRGIAGFGATWYIAAKVWGHIARAEPIDFYPLFRPFVLGFAILIFPSVIQLINQLMKPTVTGTAQMVKDSDAAVAQLLKMKEDAIKTTAYWQMYVGEDGNGDRSKWYKYNYGDKREGWLKSIGHDIRFAFAKFGYNLRNSIKQWMSEILKVLFEAAALCIDTIRFDCSRHTWAIGIWYRCFRWFPAYADCMDCQVSQYFFMATCRQHLWRYHGKDTGEYAKRRSPPDRHKR